MMKNPMEEPSIESTLYNDTTLHITVNRYSSLGYIRVQWPWIGMIYKNVTCVVIATYNIQYIRISKVDEDIQ